eukprot:TRINITY_DN7719_c0_g1_i1.p1 TRINITY_DN7719_c0_g1~~TRINITY_DN7719_c0_g1_i1.p1  ORF type:complete len:138 (+),score=15.57 TRINITY_DN7719_c0_g1_i1:58-471(+)
MPRHIGCYMERSLVDQVVPGNRVMITGIFQIKRQQIKGARARDSKKVEVLVLEHLISDVWVLKFEQAGPGRSSAQQNSLEKKKIHSKNSLLDQTFTTCWQSQLHHRFMVVKISRDQLLACSLVVQETISQMETVVVI